jgi:hypothetical protein
MIIEVKTKHFKNSAGFRSNEECPLALAIKDVMPSGTIVSVGGFTLVIDRNVYRIGEEWQNHIQIIEWIEEAQRGLDIDTVTVTLTKENK